MSSKPSVKSWWANGSKAFDFSSVDHEVPGILKYPITTSWKDCLNSEKMI